jgi:hypothetical protein
MNKYVHNPEMVRQTSKEKSTEGDLGIDGWRILKTEHLKYGL